MVDVPCLDHLWYGQKVFLGDKQIIWSMIEIPGHVPLCMPLGPLWQSFRAWITHRSVCRVVIAMTAHITCRSISHV